MEPFLLISLNVNGEKRAAHVFIFRFEVSMMRAVYQSDTYPYCPHQSLCLSCPSQPLSSCLCLVPRASPATEKRHYCEFGKVWRLNGSSLLFRSGDLQSAKSSTTYRKLTSSSTSSSSTSSLVLMSFPTDLRWSFTKLLVNPVYSSIDDLLLDGISIVLLDESHNCILHSRLKEHFQLLGFQVLMDQRSHSEFRQSIAC